MSIFKSGSGGANKTLSNLDPNTAVSVDLVPITNNSTSLGGAGTMWLAGYMVRARSSSNVDSVRFEARQAVSSANAIMMDYSGVGSNPTLNNIGIAVNQVVIAHTNLGFPVDGNGGYTKLNSAAAGVASLVLNFSFPAIGGATYSMLTNTGSGICTWSPQYISSADGASHFIASGTTVVVKYPGSNYDISAAYNGTSGIFTAPAAGKYRVSAAVDYAAPSAVGYRQVGVSKNGAINRIGPPFAVNATVDGAMFNGTINLAASDTVSVFAIQTSGFTAQFSGSTFGNFFNIEKIGN